MKFTCVVDTSSYINLAKCQHQRGTLLDLLYDNATIRFSPEVNREIGHHYTKQMPTAQTRSNNVCSVKYRSFEDYRAILSLDQSTKDRGEKDNFCSMVDMFLKEKRIGLVFLADDEKAVSRALLSKLLKAFPICQVWSSLDVVLFLFINKKIDKTVASDFLRDLNSYMATDDEKMDQEKTQKRIRKFREFNDHIEVISGVLKRK